VLISQSLAPLPSAEDHHLLRYQRGSSLPLCEASLLLVLLMTRCTMYLASTQMSCLCATDLNRFPPQALSFCGRQYVSPFAAPASAEAPRAGAKARGDEDDSSDSDGEETAAAATPAPYISAMRRTEAAAANRAQVCEIADEVWSPRGCEQE